MHPRRRRTATRFVSGLAPPCREPGSFVVAVLPLCTSAFLSALTATSSSPQSPSRRGGTGHACASTQTTRRRAYGTTRRLLLVICHCLRVSGRDVGGGESSRSELLRGARRPTEDDEDEGRAPIVAIPAGREGSEMEAHRGGLSREGPVVYRQASRSSSAWLTGPLAKHRG